MRIRSYWIGVFRKCRGRCPCKRSGAVRHEDGGEGCVTLDRDWTPSGGSPGAARIAGNHQDLGRQNRKEKGKKEKKNWHRRHVLSTMLLDKI